MLSQKKRKHATKVTVKGATLEQTHGIAALCAKELLNGRSVADVKELSAAMKSDLRDRINAIAANPLNAELPANAG